MAEEESMDSQETPFEEPTFEQKEPADNVEVPETFDTPPPGSMDFPGPRFNGPGPRGPPFGGPPRFGPRGPRYKNILCKMRGLVVRDQRHSFLFTYCWKTLVSCALLYP